jgi:hypothetical protein
MEDEGELELFFAIAWNIWHARNQRRMGEQEKPLQQIIAHATDLLMDFNKANKGLEHENRGGSKMDSPPPPPPPPPPLGGWSRHLQNNFDGPKFEDQKASGIGVVIRDEWSLTSQLCPETARFKGNR